MNAKKQTFSADDALALTKQVDEIYVAKGSRVVHLQLQRDQPDAETLKQWLLGPTGNLRAPTLRKGKTLLVGFDAETYRKVLG